MSELKISLSMKCKGPTVQKEELATKDENTVFSYLTRTGFKRRSSFFLVIFLSLQDRPLKKEKSFGERQSSVTSPGTAPISRCPVSTIFIGPRSDHSLTMSVTD